jgi:hypothetical protein
VGSFFANANLNLPPIRLAVHSLECPPDIHPAESFAHAKISNASPKIETFGSSNKQKIIGSMLVLSFA